MSLFGLIFGVIFQLWFAAAQFFILLWSGVTAGNNGTLGWLQSKLFGVMLWLLPANSVFISGLLIYFYLYRPENLSHWWHLVPILSFALYYKLARFFK